jgi:hypothetical protein
VTIAKAMKMNSPKTKDGSTWYRSTGELLTHAQKNQLKFQ